ARLVIQQYQLMQYCRRKATGGQGEFNFQDIRCRIMPRQADQGETQNTALLLQPGIFQPLAQLRLGRRQLLLHFLHGTGNRSLPRTPQGAGHMDVQLCKARVIGGQTFGGKMAATVGEGQAVAGQYAVPAAIGHPLPQQTVEQQAAGGGQQTCARAPGRWQCAPLGPLPGLLQVTAVTAEALGPEVVRHALLGDALQTLVQLCGISLKFGKTNDEVVGAVRSALQFAAVPAAGQTALQVIPQGREVRIVRARQLQAEALAGDGTPILDPGIADIPELETGDPRQLPGHILGIQIALFDQQPQVLALPAQLDIEDLGDPEVLRLRLEHRPATGLAVGPRPQPLAVCAAHRGSNRATASTAIPSLRPTKPSFSVVVALILT